MYQKGTSKEQKIKGIFPWKFFIALSDNTLKAKIILNISRKNVSGF